MVDITLDLKVRNLAELRRLMVNAPIELKQEIVQILIDEARQVANEAKSNAPIKTGELRDSIQAVPGIDGAKIEATAPHAIYQEARYHFMKNALESAKPRIRQRIEQAIVNYFMRSV